MASIDNPHVNRLASIAHDTEHPRYHPNGFRRLGAFQLPNQALNRAMPIVSLTELKAGLAPGRAVLGIDLGSNTIGLALSDTTRIIASPLETLKRGKFRTDSALLVDIINQRGVGAIVIGLPVSMDGTEGPRCQGTRQFADNLLGVVDLPIAFWDERLSTAAIERLLVNEADMSRKRRSQVVDKMAAAYILQGALDALG